MLHGALNVFISYSRDDELLLNEMVKHLSLLKRQGQIKTWHDREITAGEGWKGEIDSRINDADLILLLVSSSFIASDYCWDNETTLALDRHAKGEARVVPILLRPCDWQSAPFADIQGLPRDFKPVTVWDNQDTAWLDVAEGLRKVIQTVREQDSAGAPRRAEEQDAKLLSSLKRLYQERKKKKIRDGNVSEIDSQILDIRRILRHGPQLAVREFLCDGRYELLGTVGQGGFATVWKAWDSDRDDLVALKILHGHLSHDRSRRERFFRGARKMADLEHPNIVRVLESELVDRGWYFYVMEYLAGGNFERAVLDGLLTRLQRLGVVLAVGEALALAHRHGVVHRDVKPSNIVLDEAFQAKLTDFDLVRAQDTTGLTGTQAMMGTIQFAAPEVLGSAATALAQADIYSLGSVAVFAVAGERLPALYYRHPERVIESLDCDEVLREVLAQATAFETSERLADAEQFCEAFKRAAWEPAVAQLRPGLRGAATLEPLRSTDRWANETGEDSFGKWAAVDLEGVRFRLRWIPRGRFLMGSPESESGRHQNEGPQHEVTLERGFWIGETPCTQAQWEVVMGKNPSFFRSPDRPVEQLSWEDCVRFLKAFNVKLPELKFRLPTEIEWEYACRSQTDTSTYVGELEIRALKDGPLLDTIAWYGGNSGQGFELDSGYDSSHWTGTQYESKIAGTRPIARKQPNAWGLYDMLGNVWEWCSDDYTPYDQKSVGDTESLGPAGGKVLRGGSWDAAARNVRAASRLFLIPTVRHSILGFRLARDAAR